MRTLAVAPKESRGFFERVRVSGFEVAAFFCGPVWFFYRKMWAWAWGITGLIVVFGVLSSVLHLRGGFAVGAILSVLAHRTYVDHAMTMIGKLRTPGSSLNPGSLRAAGGVSKLAGWVSGSVYFVLVALTVLGLVLLILHPELAGEGR